jgi:hypothetical protein
MVKPDNSVEMRVITLGGIIGEVALIDKGIAAGEKLVASGQYKLVVGAKIEPHMLEPAQTAEAAAGSKPGSKQ